MEDPPAADAARSRGAARTEDTAGLELPGISELPRISAMPPQAVPPATMPAGHTSRLGKAGVAGTFVGLGLLALVFAWQGWQRHRTGTQIQSLAVLPLENLSGDPSQEYFADGMTDELTTMLAKNSSLHIISRTSAMRFKGTRKPLPDIARELGADAILEGSIARTGNSAHVTVQLIRADSDTHLWAESYDRQANDLVSLPRDASITIAKQLGHAIAATASQRYVSPEAHDAYMRGQYLWVEGSQGKAAEFYRRAVQLQPDYALGWSGLANAYTTMAMGSSPSADVMPQAEAAATRALQLDDSLAEAHNSMAGIYLFAHWDWNRALVESTRSMQLDPDFAEGRHLRSIILVTSGRWDEALAEQRKASELDPFAKPWSLASCLTWTGRYDEAIADARLRLETFPHDAILHSVLADAYLGEGMDAESVEEFMQANAGHGNEQEVPRARTVFVREGARAETLWELEQIKARAAKQYVSPHTIALVSGRLKMKEATMQGLEQAYREHSPDLVWLQNEPTFNFLHTEERFRALARRIGLPPLR